MKKIVTFNAGFDKRDLNPMKNYGIHGLEIRFILKNFKGAVTFVIYTNWLPTESGDLKWFEIAKDPKMKDQIGPMFVTLLINPFIPSILLKPLPADLGYHSPKPLYDEQELSKEKCIYIGKPCYYDGSGLTAVKIFDVLLNKGDEGLWEEMHKFHELIFGESFGKSMKKKMMRLFEIYLKFTGADESLRNIKEFLYKKKIKFVKEK